MSVQITSTAPFIPANAYPDVDIKFRVSHGSMPVTQKQPIGRVCVLDVGTTGLNVDTSNATNLAWMLLDLDADYCISHAWGPYFSALNGFGAGFSGNNDSAFGKSGSGFGGCSGFGGVGRTSGSSTDNSGSGSDAGYGSANSGSAFNGSGSDFGNASSGFGGSVAGFGSSGSAPTPYIAATPEDFLSHSQDCQLIIAHNADYDEAMLRKALPSLPATSRLPWACTLRDMPWQRLSSGYGQRFIRFKSLSDLIGLYGYYHQAHDTAEDAFALSWLLSQPYSNQGMLMQHLIRALEAPKTMITITQKPKPKERTDLSCRGYRFSYVGVSGGTACMAQWSKIIPTSDLAAEQQWLNQAITVPHSHVPLQVEPLFPKRPANAAPATVLGGF